MRLADRDLYHSELRRRVGYQNIDEASPQCSNVSADIDARQIAGDGMSKLPETTSLPVPTELISAPLPNYVYGSMVYDLGNAKMFHSLDDIHWLHRQLPEVCAELPTTLPRNLDGREPCFNVERNNVAKKSKVPISVHMRWNDQQRRMLMFTLVSKVAPSQGNAKVASVKTGYVLSAIAEFLSAHCADDLVPKRARHWNARIRDIYAAPHIHPGVKEMQTTKKQWPQYYDGLVEQLDSKSNLAATV